MNLLSKLMSAITNNVRVCDMDMNGVSLVDADLSFLQADRLSLCGANVTGAKLRRVRFGQCVLKEAKFERADFNDAVLRACLLDDSQGTGAYFNNARIEDSTAKGANLTGAEMKEAKLSETSFERAILHQVVLDGADGDGVTFRGANLSHASLIGVRFFDADFRGADLRHANLSKGYFRDADFRGALLDGTLFDYADCTGAIFDANEQLATASTGTRESEKNERPDEFLANLLNESLKNLPNMFTEGKNLTHDVKGYLHQATDIFSATTKQSPEQYKQWIESFLELVKNKETDLEVIIEELIKGPIKFQNTSLLVSVSKNEMLDHLRVLNKILSSAGNEPPDEWKSILEPIMKKAGAGEAIDFKTISGLFTDWTKDEPSK